MSVTPKQAHYVLRLVVAADPATGAAGFAGFIPGFTIPEGQNATTAAAAALSVNPGRDKVEAFLNAVTGARAAKVALTLDAFWGHLGLKPIPEAVTAATAARYRSNTTTAHQAAAPQAPAPQAQKVWSPDKVMEAMKMGLLTAAEGRKLLGLDEGETAAPQVAARQQPPQPTPSTPPVATSPYQPVAVKAQAGRAEELIAPGFGNNLRLPRPAVNESFDLASSALDYQVLRQIADKSLTLEPAAFAELEARWCALTMQQVGAVKMDRFNTGTSVKVPSLEELATDFEDDPADPAQPIIAAPPVDDADEIRF